jgi:lysophospholipid acyltransferase (LPLAT)-like uncharacterized protein
VPQKFTLKQRIVLAIVPRLASILALCLGATLRYEHVCEPGATVGFDVPAPAVYAFWHRCLLAGVWPFRNHGLTLLISQSFDGELIARTAEYMGFLSVRGSSSRDGAPGLRNPHRAWQLRSWDRFLIPKPFSRVTVAWTRPVPPDLPSVQAALDRSVQLARSGNDAKK